MFCRYCGKEIDEKAQFCNFCGRKTRDSQPVISENKIDLVSESPTETDTIPSGNTGISYGSLTVQRNPENAKAVDGLKQKKQLRIPIIVAGLGVALLIVILICLFLYGKYSIQSGFPIHSGTEKYYQEAINESQSSSNSELPSNDTSLDINKYPAIDDRGTDSAENTGSSSSNFESGSFGTNPCVTLNSVGDTVEYSVILENSIGQVASISGTAPLSDKISFSGNDGWNNIIEGKIYYISSNVLGIETTVLERAGYGPCLDIEYMNLERNDKSVDSGQYLGLVDMDALMSANILGDTFWSAYYDGWLDEWMYLYFSESSEATTNALSYNELIGDYTYYNITRAEAADAGWGDIWAELVQNAM